MAGKNHTVPSERARHSVKAVVFSCCLAFSIFPALVLRADYVITGIDGKTTHAKSYWIEGKYLFPAGSKDGIYLYDVKGVTDENLTPEDLRQHEESMLACRRQVTELLARENRIVDAQQNIMEKISDIRDVQKRKLGKKEKKVFKAEDKAQRNDVRDLIDTWRGLRLPDYSLLKTREVKLAQLLSLEASVEQTSRFIRSGDPTNWAYAEKQAELYTSFEDAFKDTMPWK